MNWIPVTDRLPEAYATVLLTIASVDGREVSTGFCAEAHEFDEMTIEWFRSRYGGDRVYSPERVVAWMPYPEPFTGDA